MIETNAMLRRLREDVTFAQGSGRITDAFFVCDVNEAIATIDSLRMQVPATKAPAILSTGIAHDLKCHPKYFEVILSGVKPFEVRSEVDRKFSVGDVLLIREWDPETRDFTGRTCGRRVAYILRGFPGIEPDYAVLGFPA